MTTWAELHQTAATQTETHVKYDPLTGLVTSVRMYDVDDDPEDIIGDLSGTNSPPDIVQVTIEGADLDLNLVDWDAVRVGTGYTHVALTYEGHVPGVMYWTSRTQGENERLLVSLDSPPQGFGPNQEGCIHITPATTIIVTGNATVADVQADWGYWDLCDLLVGAVNEDGWAPQFWAPPVVTLLEGDFLFSYAEFNRNRDQTYTYQYHFEDRPNLFNGLSYSMHQQPWAYVNWNVTNTAQSGNKDQLSVGIVGTPYTPRKYPTAGSPGHFAGHFFDDLEI